MAERRKCLYITGDGTRVYAGKNIASMKAAKGLSSLNTARGGSRGFKGFVAEHKVAESMNHNYIKNGVARQATVVDNNGLADIVIKGSNGKVLGKKQVKFTKATPKVGKYAADNQTVILPGDSGKGMVKGVRNQGASARRSSVSNTEVERLSKAMQKEGQITGTNRSRIVPAVDAGKTFVKNCHNGGVASAKKGAAFGGGMSLGSNLVEVGRGDKDVGEAAVDVAVDTAVAGGIGYGAGAIGTAITSTAPGAAVAAKAGALGAAAANTAVGGAVVTGATTAATAISGATATVLGSTIAGTAVGAAAVAAAPVVAVGVLIGGVCSLLDW